MLTLRAALKGVQNAMRFVRALPWSNMASEIALTGQALRHP
jgi:hypothetical protein